MHTKEGNKIILHMQILKGLSDSMACKLLENAPEYQPQWELEFQDRPFLPDWK